MAHSFGDVSDLKIVTRLFRRKDPRIPALTIISILAGVDPVRSVSY